MTTNIDSTPEDAQAMAREIVTAYESDGVTGIAKVFPTLLDAALGQLGLAREVLRLVELLGTTDGHIDELKIEIAAMGRSHDRRIRELEEKLSAGEQAAWDRSEGR